MEIRMDYTPSDSVRAKKHLGQHFLTAPSVSEAMVAAGNVGKGDLVLEIGPGTGVLTQKLLETGATVVAIEKDTECINTLEEKFSSYGEQFTLIEGDALSYTPGNKPYKLIANIPYYITGEIVRKFLTEEHQPTDMVLLVQKEVAERIARTQKESLLSLSVKAYGTPTYIKTVKAGSFHPKPKVDSAIIAVTNISRSFFDDISEDDFFRVLHKAFGEKRKQIGGTLKDLISVENLSISRTTRPEDIPLSEWKNIVRLMHK